MDPGTSGSGASTAGDNRGRRLPTTGRRRRDAGGYGNAWPGTVNLSNPRAIFAGSPPRFTWSRVAYEAYVVSRTSTRSQVDSATGMPQSMSRVIARGRSAREPIPVRAFESNQIRSAATGTLHVPLTGVFVSLSALTDPQRSRFVFSGAVHTGL